MSEDLHSSCTPQTEARGLFRLLSTGSTVERLRELISVSPNIERVMRTYAQEDPCEAYWLEGCVKFRRRVLEAFDQLVAAGVPVAEVAGDEEAESAPTDQDKARRQRFSKPLQAATGQT